MENPLKTLKPNTVRYKILLYLAFKGPTKPTPISKDTNIPPGTVRPSLRWLLSQRYVTQSWNGEYASKVSLMEILASWDSAIRNMKIPSRRLKFEDEPLSQIMPRLQILENKVNALFYKKLDVDPIIIPMIEYHENRRMLIDAGYPEHEVRKIMKNQGLYTTPTETEK